MSAAELRIRQRRATTALAGRETRRVLALWTQTILPPILTAILFLAVFGGALGSRIHHVEGLPYLSFILPGLLVMTVAAQSFANCSTSLFQAKNEGYIEDILTSPLRPWQFVLSYLSGGLVRGLLAALAVALLALPFAHESANPALATLALLLTGLVFSSLGVIAGIWAETFDQHAFVANIVIAPLALVSGVFYSARTLNKPWATLTRIDPLYYLVDVTRAGLTGFNETTIWVSVVVTAAVPFGRGQRFGNSLHPVLNAIFGNWNMNTEYNTQKGFPFAFPNAAPLVAQSAVLTDSQRDAAARQSGRPQYDPSIDKWFDTAIFPSQSQAPFTLRNFPTIFPNVRGKPLNNVEFSVYKEIPIRERLKWQIRADFHNALNHPWLGSQASSDVSNAAFATFKTSSVDDTSEPRLVVLSMKVIF